MSRLAALCWAAARLHGVSAEGGRSVHPGLSFVDETVTLANGDRVVARRLLEADVGLTFQKTPLDVTKWRIWPKEWPFSLEAFNREDERDDAFFYNETRLVYHIGEPAVRAITHYYKARTHTCLFCRRSHRRQLI